MFLALSLPTEKGFGEHQLSASAGHEVGQVRPRPQADHQDSAAGEGQAHHHCQQHPSSQVPCLSAYCALLHHALQAILTLVDIV